MYEDAQEIFDYLPINKTSLVEDQYITHLWKAFLTLSSVNDEGTSFALMPFHLLFMLSIQYKIFRIYKEKPSEYSLIFTISHGRNNNLRKPSSVFDIALLNERSMADVLTIIHLEPQVISQMKGLVDDRNDRLAHAKGGIETEPGVKIEQYIKILRQVQRHTEEINNIVAYRWLKDMGSDQDGADYIELHLSEEFLCPADMNQGKLSQLDHSLNWA